MPSKRRQVVGRARHRPAGHVARRCHGDDVHRRQLARDHARRQREAAADRGIEAFADDVDPAVVEVPVGQDRRVAGQEVVEQRHQEVAAEGLAHAHLERAGRLVVDPARAGHRGLQRGERTVHLAQEPLAAFGQRQPTRAALEQAHAQIGLEPGHVLADAGWRQPEDARRGGEAAVLCRPDERHQMLHLCHRRILNRGLKLIAAFIGWSPHGDVRTLRLRPANPRRRPHRKAFMRALAHALFASLLVLALPAPPRHRASSSPDSSSARSPPTAPRSTSDPAAPVRRSCCCTATARPATCGCRWPRTWRATTR